ncbi:cartilage matrix protein isoform X1 [Girardinichthys multiradiatus]|uniref:cartilage matrix protein isoform X1 n=1 Tax=Girardinichthys multiradiatus TaxID=208333 RepID=UPI001FAE044F|nr:cartilage matrix protein isoform X1 [Girardinichthys multiradiatus]
MTPTVPVFLMLLLGLMGAQATLDQRMAPGLCTTRPTDLVFIIDSSRSVRPSEFEQVKVFLKNVIDGLNVGPNATRVGVVNYASRVKNEVSLKTHRTKAALVRAVSKIEPLSTGTMTGLAIQFALNAAFSEAEGARAKSPDVSKVAIIVTDGRPQDNVKEVAQRARDAGIETFAIGVGRVDMTTLKQMASEPLDDHVDYVESYSVIEKLTKKFQEALCVSDLCATGDHDCQQVCISTPGSYKCACKDGFILMDDGRTCSACRNAAIDTVFVIDGSKSVRPENFELVKKWINQIIDKLDVSDSKTHVGLVQYSSTVKTEFMLGRYNNKKDLKEAVKKMDYMGGGTMTGMALDQTVKSVFARGARPGVQKVAIVLTDGRSQDYIGEAAKKAKDYGLKMYAVGVGNALESELKQIASEPIAEHYFYTADFKAMSQIAKKLQINICIEEDPCECDSLVKFQKNVEDALQALNKKLENMSKRIALLENKIV